MTSANLSGEEPQETAEGVLKQLDGRIDAIVVGESGGSKASTIVDMSTDELRIVREGPISEKRIREVLQD